MSGHDGGYAPDSRVNFGNGVGNPVGFAAEELAGFQQSYGPEAAKLSKVFERDGKYYNQQGEDVTDLFGSFQTWMRDVGKANAAREAYVKIKKERPGRDATILAPYTPPKAETILGQPPSSSNTVLG